MTDKRDPKKSESSSAAPPSAAEDLPSAGPHAEEHLTDQRKTPGSGALPEPGRNDEVDPGAG